MSGILSEISSPIPSLSLPGFLSKLPQEILSGLFQGQGYLHVFHQRFILGSWIPPRISSWIFLRIFLEIALEIPPGLSVGFP